MAKNFGSPEPLMLEAGDLLTPEDVQRMTAAVKRGGGGADGGPRTTVAKLRSSHHNVARLLAEGLPRTTVAALTGYEPSRIEHLEQVPAFQELLAFYSGDLSDVQVQVVDRMRNLGLDVLDIIQEKLIEDPDKIKLPDLDALLKTLMDRTGNGPTTKTLNVTATGTVSEIRDAIAGPGVTIRAARGFRPPAEADNQPLLGGPGPAEGDAPVEGEGSESSGVELRAATGEDSGEGTA